MLKITQSKCRLALYWVTPEAPYRRAVEGKWTVQMEEVISLQNPFVPLACTWAYPYCPLVVFIDLPLLMAHAFCLLCPAVLYCEIGCTICCFSELYLGKSTVRTQKPDQHCTEPFILMQPMSALIGPFP